VLKDGVERNHQFPAWIEGIRFKELPVDSFFDQDWSNTLHDVSFVSQRMRSAGLGRRI
jgi:hypothetical protein